MAGMKRWLSGFLAGLLLFSWTAALGEGSRRDTVEIQESLVSREDDSEETLEDHIRILLKLVQEETRLAGSGGIDSLEEDEFGWNS